MIVQLKKSEVTQEIIEKLRSLRVEMTVEVILEDNTPMLLMDLYYDYDVVDCEGGGLDMQETFHTWYNGELCKELNIQY